MPKCNCAGSSCGCSVTAGDGVRISGTGTAADPFIVSADISALPIADSIAVSSSTSLELGKRGSGAFGDPVVITGQVVVRSPNGTRWAPSVSDSGVATWIPAGAIPAGSTGNTGTTVVANDILYWNGTTWDTRSTYLAHAVFVSLGYNSVPLPPTFKAGDTWLCEAT